MIAFLFLLMLVAMVGVMLGRHQLSYICFTISLLLSMYWFSHHASSHLSIVL